MANGKPRKRKRRSVSKNVATDRLLNAVGDFVNAFGGGALVVGPVQILTWPLEDDRRFTLGVRVFGRRPVKAGPLNPKIEEISCGKR